MTISKRVLNKKRHTVGFIISGTEYSRAQAIKLARKGEISGVRVAKGSQGPYLVSATKTSLYSLPTTVQQPKARRTAVAAKTTKTAKTSR